MEKKTKFSSLLDNSNLKLKQTFSSTNISEQWNIHELNLSIKIIGNRGKILFFSTHPIFMSNVLHLQNPRNRKKSEKKRGMFKSNKER